MATDNSTGTAAIAPHRVEECAADDKKKKDDSKMSLAHMTGVTDHEDDHVGVDEEMASLPRRRKKRYAVSVRWEREYEEEHNRRSKPICTGTAEDFHTCCCCCSRRVGSMFFLMETRDGSPIIVAGPCWPFCTFVTLPLILLCSALVSYFVVFNKNSGLPSWFGAVYLPFLAMTLISLFCVSCRDPGLLERVTDEEAGHGGWFWNEQVGSFRPPGAMYCRECKVSYTNLKINYRDFFLRVVCFAPWNARDAVIFQNLIFEI
mmetsp:Transcript_29317/g.38953  ORF Transcript_29317/g.38953 Transcript_29317/m.38953 type:complete len:261 (+) Transcript_29317:42-824(+)